MTRRMVSYATGQHMPNPYRDDVGRWRCRDCLDELRSYRLDTGRVSLRHWNRTRYPRYRQPDRYYILGPMPCVACRKRVYYGEAKTDTRRMIRDTRDGWAHACDAAERVA